MAARLEVDVDDYSQHPDGFYYEVADLPGSDFGPLDTLEKLAATAVYSEQVCRRTLGRASAREDYVLFEVRDGVRIGRAGLSADDWSRV